MQYAYTSLKTVIGNVIRNTRIKDSSFIADIHEWLYEAMDMMETQFSLEGTWEEVKVNFHKAKLPCGLKYIDAVEYQGHRLREGGGVRPAKKDRAIHYDGFAANAFRTNVEKINSNGHQLYYTTLSNVNASGIHPFDYYNTDMGVLNTSFADGCVTIYFRKVKTDEDGFPMIPDNQNYKQALYWYCRAMMIGAGWNDKQFTYQQCFEQFEHIYGPRATAEIRLPSPEQMEHRINTFVRFLPHQGYYDSFFSTDRREPMYDIRGVGQLGASGALGAQQPFIPGTQPNQETIH